ncbi:MAG: hypothetical protein R3F65_25555 [bacterium]
MLLGLGEGFDLGDGAGGVAPAVPAEAVGLEIGVEHERSPGHVELAAELVSGFGEVGGGVFGGQWDLTDLRRRLRGCRRQTCCHWRRLRETRSASV